MKHALSSQAELRRIYGVPGPDSYAVRCVLPRLDRHHRAFIALSPFIVLASADAQGRPDVSPRGDLPGFVIIRDETTLLIPDRSGNKKLVTLSNVLENPNVALVFFVPGRVDTLRIRGEARITADPALLAAMAGHGQAPRSALLVTVRQAWLHCGKALLRSRLWDPEAHVAPDALPTLGRMLADQIKGLEAREAEEAMASYYETTLWSDPGRID